MEEKTVKKYSPKKCDACYETKTTNFFKRGCPICKECQDNKVTYDITCRDCEEQKPNTGFRLNRKTCIECERSSGRNYRKTTTKAAEWVENNRERMSELQHNHYEINKEKIRMVEKERLKNDPLFRLIKSYRKTVSCLIHGKSSFNKKLDINYNNYKLWMQFRFDDDMKMSNYTDIWEVDHVLPLDMLKTKKINGINIEENLDCLFLWFNTMPVLCSHNMKKNKYLDTEQLTTHMKMIDLFLDNHEVSTDNFTTYKIIVHKLLNKSL